MHIVGIGAPDKPGAHSMMPWRIVPASFGWSAMGAQLLTGRRSELALTRNRFYARPFRDRGTGRWMVDTNIDGLFVEAATEQECREVIAEFAPDLIRDNHGIYVGSVSTGEERQADDQSWRTPTPA